MLGRRVVTKMRVGVMRRNPLLLVMRMERGLEEFHLRYGMDTDFELWSVGCEEE